MNGAITSFSRQLVEVLGNVEFPERDDAEAIRCTMRGAIETVELIESLGWYESTKDFDLEWSFRLRDGRTFTCHAGAVNAHKRDQLDTAADDVGFKAILVADATWGDGHESAVTFVDLEEIAALSVEMI